MKINNPQLIKSNAYINGEWVGAEAQFDVTNPATGEVITRVADLNQQHCREAIRLANDAWPAWRNLLAGERAALLKTWHQLILHNADDLAAILSLEQGKPLAEARGEIAYGAGFIEWYAEEAKRVYGDIIPPHQQGRRLLVLKQPVGVCGMITPWNFPNAMITRKVAPALAAGCPVIVKPAEDTPLSALALAELADQAGFPPGIFNVISTTRYQQIGEEMTESPLLRKLSFTGSTAVGKILMRQCAETLTRVSLELGGNAPFIVFEDADVGAAIEGAMASKYRNSGQTCVCSNRLIVHDSIYDEFAEKLTQAVKILSVGAADEEQVQQGPLINEAAVEKVEAHILDAIENGARVMTGGQRHALGGTFFEPTVIVDVNQNMRIACEETFGPVAPIFRFHDEAEAIALANDTEFGLAAYFYSRDIARIWRVAEALESGMVGVNSGIISTEVAPFGGVKESGIGREGSKYGIEEYLEMKYVSMGF